MTVTTSISYEAGEYESALSDARLDVVRTGAGNGPNSLRVVSFDGAEMFSGRLQFPVIGRATVADDTIAVAAIVAAPPGTRWCEIDVSAGDVLVYGPGAEHFALSPAGVEYRFALIDLSRVDEMSEGLRAPIDRPARGSVNRCNPNPAVEELATQLLSLRDPLASPGELPSSGVGLFRSAAVALADPSVVSRELPASSIQSRAVVNACVDMVDTLGRSVSIAELCLAAHVSERRLRSAFHDTFGRPPSEFFRIRLLSRARARLQAGGQSVTQVALDLGFNHLGRFAQQYARQFGEHPRHTLAEAAAGPDRNAHRPAPSACP